MESLLNLLGTFVCNFPPQSPQNFYRTFTLLFQIALVFSRFHPLYHRQGLFVGNNEENKMLGTVFLSFLLFPLITSKFVCLCSLWHRKTPRNYNNVQLRIRPTDLWICIPEPYSLLYLIFLTTVC